MLEERKNNHLYFDGCDTVTLAQKYGTPLYVYSENAISKECSEIRECFLDRYENTRAAYACKAFSTLAMCRIMEREGFCLDVVSGGELYTAIRSGFPAERIEFNGNNKLPDELELAVDYGIGRIIVDGLTELARIESICRKLGKTANILYRITPGVDSHTHDFIQTGKKDSKFGIPLDDDIILPAVKAAVDSDCINFLGFHFHVGSQLFDNGSHLAALDITLKLTAEVKRLYGFDIKELNVGGGFGAVYTTEQRKPYSYFLDPIMERISAFSEKNGLKRPEVVIEPGRSLIAEAGMTLYTVGSIKEIPGIRTYVSVDGGMTDNIRPALYDAEYKAILASRMDASADSTVTICGKCCESGDILIRDARLPKVEAGDTLAVLSTGAYGYSMASNYNKNHIPAVVLIKDGDDTLVVRRQTYQDMIEREILPARLGRK